MNEDKKNEMILDDNFLSHAMMTWVKNVLAIHEGKPPEPEITGEEFKQYFITLAIDDLLSSSENDEDDLHS